MGKRDRQKCKKNIEHYYQQFPGLGRCHCFFLRPLDCLVFRIVQMDAQQSTHCGFARLSIGIHRHVFDEPQKNRKLVLVVINGRSFHTIVLFQRVCIYQFSVFSLFYFMYFRVDRMEEKIKQQPLSSVIKQVKWQNAVIAYRVYGDGQQVAVGLHGFSLSSAVYEGLGNQLKNDCTLIAIDFPLHGNSVFPYPDWDTADLYAIIETIIWQEKAEKISNIWLLAHSLGGRVALAFFEDYHTYISKLVLFAPDGMVINFWNSWSVNNPLGRWLFRRFCHSSRIMVRIATIARKLHLINESILKLVRSSIGTEKDAMLLYARSIMFRNFKPNAAIIGEIIAQNTVPEVLFLGKYDRIIPPKFATPLVNASKNSIQVKILHCGHMILADKNQWPIIRDEILSIK